jgi:hypothetical protein
VSTGVLVRSLACLRLPCRLSTEDGTHPVDPEGILLLRRPGENPTLFADEVDAYAAIVRTVAHGLRWGYAWEAELYEVQPWGEWTTESRKRAAKPKRKDPEAEAA